jgi:hypothetical protein
MTYVHFVRILDGEFPRNDLYSSNTAASYQRLPVDRYCFETPADCAKENSVVSLKAHVQNSTLCPNDSDAPDLSRIDDAVVVVAHFAQALGADGWALTTSSDHSVTRSLADDGLADEFRDALLRVADRIDPGVRYHVTVPVWCELLHPHRPATAMVMAVQWTPGHACIFVNLLFADLDDDKRKSVERALSDQRGIG